ncbi:hypothetical protein PR048_011578 [Dryococelus australis]|uniref:Uncharacterized protein n=1 Tax=Dryococelus australis TaxID=614101 RepID=A0ABQ9HMQ7_9NEOP|nr:hypothetical protein PR048_011578 [Dryococelus australis]
MEQQLHLSLQKKYHELSIADFVPRIAFIPWLPLFSIVDLHFPMYVFFTNEACFTTDGKINSRNSDAWTDENPSTKVVRNHQERFAGNMQEGKLNDYLARKHIPTP